MLVTSHIWGEKSRAFVMERRVWIDKDSSGGGVRSPCDTLIKISLIGLDHNNTISNNCIEKNALLRWKSLWNLVLNQEQLKPAEAEDGLWNLSWDKGDPSIERQAKRERTCRWSQVRTSPTSDHSQVPMRWKCCHSNGVGRVVGQIKKTENAHSRECQTDGRGQHRSWPLERCWRRTARWISRILFSIP